MKRLLLLSIVPAVMFGDDLKSLLSYASEHNNLINATEIVTQAKQKELSSVKSSYFPTIDVAGFYKRDDDASPFQPGSVYGAKAIVGLDIYDGGKKKYTKLQKEREVKAAKYSSDDTKKEIALSITKSYYNLKSLQASLSAFNESSKAVKAQLERVKHFYAVDLATSDDVDRLQSAYDSTSYAIESLKFQITSLKKALELQVGKEIPSIEDSTFVKEDSAVSAELDSIRALKQQKKALLHMSETIDSYNYPMIHIEDTYSMYGYQDKPVMKLPVPGAPATPIELLDNQNEIMATLSMRLYDFGVLSEQKEAVKLQADALNEKIIFQSKEQKMQQELALERIKTAKLNIKSSQSALKAATSALKTITEKYSAGIVDNVVYLDALSSKTQAQATYKKALNDLEIAYATYYYYNNKNLEEFIQ